MTLDLTKPLMRRDGVPVTEFHKWANGWITYRIANGSPTTVDTGGCAIHGGTFLDLINVPAPLFVWVAVSKNGEAEAAWPTDRDAEDRAWFKEHGYRIVKVDVEKGRVP